MLDELIKRYPILERVREDIGAVYGILERCYENGGKLLIAGNGGSAADAEHIVGELMKGFVKRRPVTEEMKEALEKADPVRGKELSEKLQGGLPAIALVDHAALSTAFANDVDGMLSYAQQVNGYGKPGDVFLGISTSGNAENVMYSAVTDSQERTAGSWQGSPTQPSLSRKWKRIRSRSCISRCTMRCA